MESNTPGAAISKIRRQLPRTAPHDRNTAPPRCSSRPRRNPLKSNPATGTPALSHGGAPIPQREGQTRTGARSACTRASSCSSPRPRFPSTRNAPSDTGSECGGLLPEQSDPAPAAAGDPKGRKRRRKAKPLSPRKIEPFKVCAIAGAGKFQPIACQNTGQRRLRGAFRKKPPYARKDAGKRFKAPSGKFRCAASVWRSRFPGQSAPS